MEAAHRASAEAIRSLLSRGEASPGALRAALLAVPARDRDVWLDRVLGLGPIPEDGPELPRNCVPYLPCSVDVLLRLVDTVDVRPPDVFVDIGAGVGRAAVLVHLLTGAAAIGLEIQPALVRLSRELSARLNISQYTALEGDAEQLTAAITRGTIFFLYCPFSGERLRRVLDNLEAIARTRQIRVCAVDLPLPPRPWLALDSPDFEDLAVYRSTLPGPPAPP